MRMTMLRFGSAGNAGPGCLHGFHPPEAGFTWSDGPTCAVQVASPSAEPCMLVVQAKPFLAPPVLETARIEILVDGEPLVTIDAMQDFVLCLKLPRREAGALVRISFLTPDCTRPNDAGGADRRLLGVALETLAIVETASAMATMLAVLGDPGDAIGRDLASWAAREMLPWAVLKPGRVALARAFDALNIAGWCQMFRIEDGKVSAVPKPAGVAFTDAVASRGALYRAFFEDVVRLLPQTLKTEICVCLADQLHTHFAIPVMAFQKHRDFSALTIPDMEFLQHRYFTGQSFTDAVAYGDKKITACFSGATTGGPITTAAIAAGTVPRLRAAHAFQDNPHVDFRLPEIVECADEPAEAVLREAAFCRRPRLDWQQQFRHRFLISMDGNGATCSRLAIALHSQSCLLKYDSPHRLFYAHGLHPSVHYVPIGEDMDVMRVVAMEQASPGLFGAIARDGRAFAADYLTEARLKSYCAMLLRLYAHFQS